MTSPTCTPFRSGLTILIVGTVLFLFGIICGVVLQDEVDAGLTEVADVCGPKDDSYKGFASNTESDSPPKYKYYYGYNATNAAAYLAQHPGAPTDLVLDMKGPYVMQQFEEKFDVKFNDELSNVYYKMWEHLEFKHDMSCEGCSNTDYLTNMSPGFLKALTAAGSEYAIGLGLSNVDLAHATKPQCNMTTIAHSLSAPCIPTEDPLCCCNSNATLSPSDPDSCLARASGILGEFAGYDGGVKFMSPTLKRETYSPLFVTKNVHEAGYGHPSALLGLLSGLQAARARDQAALGALARYSGLAYAACRNSPEGTAPPQSALKGTPVEYLNLITCSPLKTATYWFTGLAALGGASRCQAMSQKPGFELACKCLDPNAGVNGTATVAKPCCTYLGLGCLAQVPGYVTSEQYLSKTQSRAFYPDDGTKMNTGCGHYPAGQEFWQTEYESSATKNVWAQNGRPQYSLPTQPEVAARDTTYTYVSTVRGSDGTRAAGVGKTSSFLSSQLNDGKPKHEKLAIFITQVMRPASVYYTKTEKYMDVNVAHFEPRDDLLAQNALAPFTEVDNGVVGAGTPYTGISDITFLSGFPAYVSMPVFLHGDEQARTNGIKLLKDGKDIVVDEDTYKTYLLVEPSSGMTVVAHKRLQANFGLYQCTAPQQQLCRPDICPNNVCGVMSLSSPFVPGGKVVPQYWMDEFAAAEKKQMDKIKAVRDLSLGADAILLIFPMVGAALAILGAFKVYKARRATPGIDRAALLNDAA